MDLYNKAIQNTFTKEVFKMKKYIKMFLPFNYMEEMTKTAYVIKKVLAFLLLYFGSAVLGEAVIIGALSAMGYDPLHGVMPDGNIAMLMQYYGFAFFLLMAILYCKFIEKRTIKAMGYNKQVFDYLLGAVMAVVLLDVILGVCCLLGGVSYVGMEANIELIYTLALLGGLMIQGAAEEALCRGFLMQSLLKKVPVWIAILVSSTAFAYPHFSTLFEADFAYAAIGIVNLYLISILFSLLILYRANIWISCGLHSIWNFLLYGVFGLTLSGNEVSQTGMICFEAEESSIINGGVYGIEASIVTTVILGAAVFMLGRLYKMEGKTHGIS